MQAVRPLREDGTKDLARCLYFMGLRQRPAPVVPGQKKAAVNLNVPVAEFRCQARSWLRLQCQQRPQHSLQCRALCKHLAWWLLCLGSTNDGISHAKCAACTPVPSVRSDLKANQCNKCRD